MPDADFDLEQHYRNLQQHAQAINDMAGMDGWVKLVDGCNAMLYQIGDRILSGQVRDREQYVKDTAFREGVLWVLASVDRMNRSLSSAREQVAEIREQEAAAA